MLTDGYASDKNGVLETIKHYCQNPKNANTKVFTFGISDACDVQLVTQAA
jgi:hypothetical protein